MNPEQHWFMWRLAIQLQEQGPPETWHLSIVSGPPELLGGLQRAGLLIKPKRLSKAGVDWATQHTAPERRRIELAYSVFAHFADETEQLNAGAWIAIGPDAESAEATGVSVADVAVGCKVLHNARVCWMCIHRGPRTS